MKKLKIFSCLLAILFTFHFAACGCGGKVKEPDETIKDDNPKEITVMTNLENIQPLGERENVKNALCGTDALGREIAPAGTKSNTRLVGLFYTLWLGNYYSDEGQSYFPDTIYDMSKMDFDYLYRGVGGSPLIKMHYFGEPVFGYYNQRDIWVVDRHVRMFIAADIDFLGIDATNNDFYPAPLEVLLSVLDAYRVKGYKVPKIMFLTNTDSAARVTQIYEHLYEGQRYKELWFTDPDGGRNDTGKPWITIRQEDKIKLRQAVFKTFYFRESQWPNETFRENGFPWIEFTRPQPVHNGIISVSVAQNNGMHMSNSVQFEISPNSNDYYNSNWGRGYSATDNVNSKTRVNSGSNFQEQWEVAIASDARIAFVLEWNEWAALKLVANVKDLGQKVVFFDCASPEFSRDIEPIKGYYGDSFYMQLIYNVRRFKGDTGAGITVDAATITEAGVNWNAVSSGVADFSGGEHRNFINCNGKSEYKNETLRNDISEIRVAADSENVYVLLTCENDVIEVGDDLMNLWIKTGDTAAPCGYNYKVGIRENGISEIIDLESGNTINATYRVSGRYVEYVIPRALFGNIFEMKATDNVNLSDDVMSAYTEGDSAPYGRLNYKFNLR